MTQIRSMAQPSPRRPGELGVHSLDHFNFVGAGRGRRPRSSMACSGSTPRRRTASSRSTPTAIRTAGAWCRRGRARSSPTSRSARSRTTFRASASGWRSCGSTGSIRPRASSSNGLWFRDPDGTLVEIRVAEKSSPNAEGHLRDEGRRRRPPERAEPQQGAYGAAAAARACPALRHRHLAGDQFLPRRARACGCRTAPAIWSPSCTASTAATIT